MAAPQVVQEIISSNEFGYLNNVISNAEIVINNAEAWAEGTRNGQLIIEEELFEYTHDGNVYVADNNGSSEKKAEIQANFMAAVGYHPGQRREYTFTFQGGDIWGVQLRTYDGLNTTTEVLPLTTSFNGDIIAYGFSYIGGDPNIGDTITFIISETDPIYQHNSKYWAQRAEGIEDNILRVEDTLNTVVANESNINAVVANESNINAVVANASNINAAVANASNINAVANNRENIDIVASNESNINTIISNESNINTVASNISNIQAWSNNAEAAAASAQTYASNIENMTVSASNTTGNAAVSKTAPQGVVNLHFEIPYGPTPDITIGTVSTVAYNQSPTITNTGTVETAIFNFGIPEGKPGVGISILGTVDSSDDLPSVHSQGDMYFVGTNASYHIWMYDDYTYHTWIDVGRLEGQEGESAYQAAPNSGYTADKSIFDQEMAYMTKVVEVNATEPSAITNVLWIKPESAASSVEVPTISEMNATFVNALGSTKLLNFATTSSSSNITLALSSVFQGMLFATGSSSNETGICGVYTDNTGAVTCNKLNNLTDITFNTSTNYRLNISSNPVGYVLMTMNGTASITE